VAQETWHHCIFPRPLLMFQMAASTVDTNNTDITVNNF
jgi:hypothetical protein